MPARRLRSDERGFTLIEVLVAIFILLVGVLGVVSLIDGANFATAKTKSREGGTNLAREILDGARAVDYDKLNPTEIVGAAPEASRGSPTAMLPRRGGRSPAAASTTRSPACARLQGRRSQGRLRGPRRRRLLRQLEHDGHHGRQPRRPASHGREDRVVGGGAQVVGSADDADHQPERQPGAEREDVLRDRASRDLSARPARGRRSASFRTRPTRRSRLPRPPHPRRRSTGRSTTPTRGETPPRRRAGPPRAGPSTGISQPSGPSRATRRRTGRSTATTSSAARRSTRTASRASARTLTVTVNRSLPFETCGFEGGYNDPPGNGPSGQAPVVDLQWRANPERDIVGYRVYRKEVGSPSAVEVCALTIETSCFDSEPRRRGPTTTTSLPWIATPRRAPSRGPERHAQHDRRPGQRTSRPPRRPRSTRPRPTACP